MNRKLLSAMVILIAAVVAALVILGADRPAEATHDEHEHAPATDQNAATEPQLDGNGNMHDEPGHDRHAPDRTTIADDIALRSGVRTAVAGPAVIFETLQLTGSVQAIPANLAEVRPRFPGIVRSIRRDIGDAVDAGDTLATVESNESLRTFSIVAPIDGMIVARDIQIGQVVGDEPLFRIVDLRNVWVQLDAFGRNKDRVRAGQFVRIETLAGYSAEGQIGWLSPLVAHGSQSVRARVPLANPDGLLRPGQFVRGHMTIGQTEVPLAVRTASIQTLGNAPVVFRKSGETYVAHPVTTGRADAQFTEVRAGIDGGDEYVIENSYLIKADIGKAGASHDH